MTSRLADRLVAARRRRFVGRDNERELFRSALAAPELPFVLLHVYGPGGVGKTTLLKEFLAIAAEMGIPALYLDARNVDPSPEGVLAALHLALGLSAPENPIEVLCERGGRQVLVFDTGELLAPLVTWLREMLLPQLPDDTLIVFADRRPPVPAWYTDPGWQDLIHILALRNLSPDESKDYLARRNIPAEHHKEVLTFTHGHPLALSLVADVFAHKGDVRFQAEATPDVVKALLEQLVQKVPGPSHRTALEVCALVRVTTEALLSEVLDAPDVHELFDWLRGLSFIDSAPLGLFPHDLAREALSADLRWRNRNWYAELHRRVRNFYTGRLEKASPLEQQIILFDYIFLHRDNPVVRPFLEWQESGTSVPNAMSAEDVPRLVEMVRGFEGEESAGIARYWFERQPAGVLVFRDAEQNPNGFLMSLSLEQLSNEDAEVDPAIAAARRFLGSNAPLRSGEVAKHFRFWMAADTYQSVSPIQSLIFVNAVRHYFTPGLVYSFFPVADLDFWAPLFAYADLHHVAHADFEVGGKRYGVYGHDWRAVPVMSWLTLLAEREIAAAPDQTAPTPASSPVVVLSEEEFESAVQEAMRSYTRPEMLKSSPLLQSRLVIERAGASSNRPERIAALQRLILDACEHLQRSPREAKFYKALLHTYIKPAATQEVAAEMLDLPFSTYRRHLKQGMERVCEVLWQWELHGITT
ncbi:MAG: ATP-binding protein [Chloroflexota bacterium]|nr:ATP-binding protein [Chloroflexota bacterium]MDQ5866956.1 ATP-binding protein [Chloroflexota bacterium]